MKFQFISGLAAMVLGANLIGAAAAGLATTHFSRVTAKPAAAGTICTTTNGKI